MEASSSRMCLRKRSSTDSVDSMRCEPRSPAIQVLGKTKLDLPDTCGRSSFYLATHWTGRGSLRHYLSGLHKLERCYREVELLMVAGDKVKGWSHIAVSNCLRHHFGHVTSATECRMTLRATDHAGKKHLLEIQFDVIYEDGGGASEKARAFFDVIIRLVDNVINKPDVTDVMYKDYFYIRVRHGAQTDCFLRVGDDNTVCMEVPKFTDRTSSFNPRASDVFKCYRFTGHNHTICRRGGGGRCPRRCRAGGGGGGGGGDGSWPELCVLQELRTNRFVVASALSSRLKADHDGPLQTSIESIQKPDPRFFIRHPSGDGDPHQYCLRPLMLCNYFLRYDDRQGLKLERCDCPPYQDPAVVRQFSFQFMQIH